jgi:hypothetical protein
MRALTTLWLALTLTLLATSPKTTSTAQVEDDSAQLGVVIDDGVPF